MDEIERYTTLEELWQMAGMLPSTVDLELQLNIKEKRIRKLEAQIRIRDREIISLEKRVKAHEDAVFPKNFLRTQTGSGEEEVEI